MTFLYLLVLAAVVSVSWATSSEHDLIAQLVENYPEYRDARPVMDSSDVVPLQMEYVFTNIVDFDEDNAVLGVHGWFKESWVDEYMTWDVNETGIEELRVSTDHCWHPDVRSYQSLVEEFGEQVMMGAWPSGHMMHVPPSSHRIQCEKGESRYSFHCHLNIGSWTYHKDLVEMSLFSNSTGVDMDYYHEHPRWNVETQAEIIEQLYECCPDHPYQSLRVDFTLTRK